MKKILLLAAFAFIGFTSLEAQSDRTTRSDDDRRTTRTSDRNDSTKGSASFEDTLEELTSDKRNLVNCDHLAKVLDYISDNMGGEDVDPNSYSRVIKSLPIDDCKPTRGCDCEDIQETHAQIVDKMRR